ncbi:MAG TPA: glycerophosphodiester phosphodiesterase, partial [Coprothermobacter sp.]|nr:glycerophosphodiester phosphodiesterase [Coprothermobacter sp.]
AGADGFELDVMVTTDGVPVLFHDPNLKRLHGMDVWVEQVSYDQLKDILHEKQQVCTLQEALSLADDRRCWVDIEIKTSQWVVVRDIVGRFSPQKKIISSFRHDVVSDWSKLDKGKYVFSYIYQHFPKDIGLYLGEVDLLKPEMSFLDERYDGFVSRVLPWSVNEKEKVLELKEKGYFGAITDFPGLLKEERQQIDQGLGYLKAAVKEVETPSDGIRMVLVNTLAPVQLKEISSDAQVETSVDLPLWWDVGQSLTVIIKGKPSYLLVDTSYTGAMKFSFSQLMKWLHKGIN